MNLAKHKEPIPDNNTNQILNWDLNDIYPSIESREFTVSFQAAHAQVKTLKQDAAVMSALDLSDLCEQIDKFDLQWEQNRDLIQELFVYCDARLLLGDNRAVVVRARATIVKLAVLNQQSTRPIVQVLSLLDDVARATALTRLSRDATSHRYARWVRVVVNDTAPPKPKSDEAKVAYHALLDSLTVSDPTGQNGDVLPIRIARRTLWKASPDQREPLAAAIKERWAPHQTLVAQAIYDRCRPIEGLHPFADALSEDGLSPRLADNLFSALTDARDTMQQVFAVQGRLLGTQNVSLIELTARWPSIGILTLDTAVSDVGKALDRLDPEMQLFFAKARSKGWIDARPTQAGRSVSDLQTAISRRKHPLVLVNYDGLPRNAIRLAHETAHAYHFYLIRDRAAEQHAIPTPLAEIVSAVAEQSLRDVWAEAGRNGDRTAALRFAWMEAESLFSCMLQLPMNAAFELQIAACDRPPEPEKMHMIVRQLGQEWFGKTLHHLDETAWASTPTFVTARRFHGVPYITGYLAAQTITADMSGAAFRGLLEDMSDTPTQTILARLLGGPVDAPATWQAATSRVEQRLADLQTYVDTLDLGSVQ